ncbi:uncharacterized protein LOC135683671 [Rhopilema esculentum]|uniref:uncharacterized protein LOC135683671 n=1 Tax=Rhopilema esculentum TaxID=499914 RepID=UPI0031D61583
MIQTDNIAIFKTVIFLIFVVSAACEQTCNGLAGLCQLRLNQVTLAGTHNSGAGFDGHLWYGSGVKALSCFYRNQGASITGQLDLGIRYFDIDACWNSYENAAYTCHMAAYGGSIAKMLDQVDAWMNKNRKEVVVLHFNRDYDKSEQPGKIGKDIINKIKARWEPTQQRLSSKELSVQTNYYATLGRAVTKNQRIYIIMHTELSKSATEPWLFWQHYVGYTWHSMSFIASSRCINLADKVAENCFTEAKKGRSLIRLDLYLTYGLCIHDLASWCNTRISPAAKTCRKNARQFNKTVNFIVIDYADSEAGKKVKDIAKNENLNNIKYYTK